MVTQGCDFFSLAAPGVQGLSPYQPGKPMSELQREFGLTKIVKLASNENPMAPSSTVANVLIDEIPTLSHYPDGNGFELKQVLSQHLAVDEACITLGNGSNDVLEMIARAFVSPQDDVIFSQYAFAVYPIVTQAIGARPRVSAAGNGEQWPMYGHDLDAMQAQISERTRLIFIANPNNPTGTWVNAKQLRHFMGTVPKDILVVIDEAYFEYVEEPQYPDTLSWISQHSNLIVTRTFSKAYGLAGLRVGYSVSHPDIANLLNRVRQPFNVNHLALKAAIVALGDEQYLQDSRQLNQEGLVLMTEGIRRLGLDSTPSLGNFLMVDVGRDAQPVFQALLAKGVIVRPVENYGLPQHLRISTGTQADIQFFLTCLEQVLNDD